MDVYAAPGTEEADPADARAQLPMVRYAQVVLGVLAAINLVISVAVPFLYGGLAMQDPELGAEAVPFMMGAGVCLGLFVVTIAVVPMTAAIVGLRRGAIWGWVLTVIVGAMYAPSLCLPFGAFLLYAMLNQEVRKAYLDQEQ